VVGFGTSRPRERQNRAIEVRADDANRGKYRPHPASAADVFEAIDPVLPRLEIAADEEHPRPEQPSC
jgi:hypothetical protein